MPSSTNTNIASPQHVYGGDPRAEGTSSESCDCHDHHQMPRSTEDMHENGEGQRELDPYNVVNESLIQQAAP
jgi:hypothetical protein